MMTAGTSVGGTPIATAVELSSLQRRVVRYVRAWFESPGGANAVLTEAGQLLDPGSAWSVVSNLNAIFRTLARCGRRPLVRHKPDCICVGTDERCFAHFIETAATGQREDALLLASLMVREDAAPLVVAHAQRLGLALMRMDMGGGDSAPAKHRNDNPDTGR